MAELYPAFDAALSAAPPTGVTDPNWWQTYLFSDSFHPTPYGHQLLGQLISRSLALSPQPPESLTAL